jgi:hypothetical protein
MNSENSITSQNGQQFSQSHFETIISFVRKYDSLYNDLGKLETEIQNLLKKQGQIVNSLTETRDSEEAFFERLSKETGKEISYLKNLASAWVIENKK